ncbi:ATP-binding protein [Pseudomonas panipatensis]|uniref:histidine kinase n=1 Tax=Pseudomonas panipatensis TaxID=428992 RepID=A0A1G8G737_9PSED|nr:ATP-binding protein [Pseudomonas panipatensis]SDH90091.1 two-component system, OmpR family, sensor histidine kinase PhoQ [Pseudomonas panipatensis]SMP45035.1 two-component system, OmpR family, sensor histidine kinase PhoQ [Pseudomonas panipatensis]
MIRSLRVRLMIGAATLAVLFMLALLPALQRAFSIALENAIQQRLGADVATLVSSASIDGDRLSMPEHLAVEDFNLPESKLLGFIYDRHGKLVWRSSSTLDESVHYQPRFDGHPDLLTRTRDDNGNEFFVYDVEISLLGGKQAAYSIVTMQPVSEFRELVHGFREQLYLWLGGALLVLLGLLWLGLGWGFRSMRGLRVELDQIEAGERERLSDEHPQEMLRLTDSLNRLLDSERSQRERYRNSLADLAHSLKTPLAVLQGVSENLAGQAQNREQVQVLQSQIERMSQQISYQLQRASLRKSGLVRHRAPLAPLLDTLSGALDKVYRDKRVILERDFPAKLSLPLEQGALLELLGNLLENAYRLCLTRVRVSARQQGGGYELVVEDDGPGVPPHQRQRILQRGERLDTQHPGQGIGTAVVKDIIDSYGGKLELDDSALGGARFRICLPG